MSSRRPWRAIVILAVGAAAAPLVACGSSGTPTSRPTVSTSGPPASVTPSPGGHARPSTAAPTTPSASSEPTTPGPPDPQRLAGRVLTAVPTSRSVVALTFDAGANAAGLPAILEVLAREHVPATFFLTGRFAQLFPDSARAIAAGGGLIGNHTYDHPDLTTLSDALARQELLDGAAAIRVVTGKAPLPWFRFPYGAYNTRLLGVVNGLGYAAVGWTIDTLGWKGTSGGVTTAVVQQRALGGLRPGEIVLMHVGSNPDDGTTLDAAALPGIIAGIRAHGYGFVTLAAALTG